MIESAQVSLSLPPVTPTHWINYSNTGTRVILWPGAIDALADEVSKLGCTRVMVTAGRNTRQTQLFQKVMKALGDLVVTVFEEVVEHSSTVAVTKGAAIARAEKIDGFVAVGGGSSSDTAKGIAIMVAEGGKIEDHASSFVPPDKFYPTELHQPKLPVIAVPTTASAAEVTPGLGIRAEDGRKLLFWDVKLACRLIVLDPQANIEVPASLMAATAMNGFAHCAEGLYSRMRNPISEGLALQGIRILSEAIPAMVKDPASVDHRAGVLAGAHISGMVISNARVGIHHAVCHCLGALGGLGHGVSNSIMLPHALAYNLDVANSQLARMADAMGADIRNLTPEQAATCAIEAVRELQSASKVPTRLRDTGLDKALLPAIAEHTLSDRGMFFNPRRTNDAAPILAMLEAAW
ncbi:alcohol dehydrogenase [Rhodoligotrophos appendicifer]|uniref:iron-containing alcohol dehydrogenase family protein n=1 Tax=Rhodoligotrophos appendicifer TaxID=987056 RepID=UPI001186C9DE|nr:iron-containing alcohol dehydrogenase [Rhodoligotrophos appendicifer]